MPLGGDFNVANSLMALSIVAELGVDLDVADRRGLEPSPAVPGRFEVVDTDEAVARGITVVVDYAHTPDGLERLLLSRPGELTDARVIVVFGCGGRPGSCRSGRSWARSRRGSPTRVIVTSDNPRGENPDAIIDDDHRRGRRRVPCRGRVRLADRRAAIATALEVGRGRRRRGHRRQGSRDDAGPR